MKPLRNIFLFQLLLICLSGSAQPYASYFVPWSTLSNFQYFGSINTIDNGILEMRSQASNRFVVTKIQSSGMPAWQKVYTMGNAQETYIPFAITGLPGGEFVVSGSYMEVINLSAVGTFLMRFDSTGTLLLAKVIACGNPQQFGGSAPLISNDSIHLYFIGQGRTGFLNGGGQCILKTDLNGSVLTQNFFQMPDQFMHIKTGVVDANGDLVLIGSIYSDALLFIRLDSNLQILYRQRIDINGLGDVSSMSIHPDGDFIVACDMGNSSGILKLNSLGQVVHSTSVAPIPINGTYETGGIVTNSQGQSFLQVGRAGYFYIAGNPYIFCFDDTLGVIGSSRYYGDTPESILLRQDQAWFTTTSLYGVNGYNSVSYIQTDTLGTLTCNSGAVPLNITTLASPSYSLPPVTNMPALGFSSFNFIYSVSSTPVPQLIDYCLYDWVTISSDNKSPAAFPNPAQSTLQLPNNFSDDKYRISDISGRIICEGVCSADGIIYIRELESGSYILVVDHDSTPASFPFIKN